MMTAVLKRVGTVAAPADARNRPLAQNPRRTQAAKITATASIIPQRKSSAPGATLIAESPSNPSKLTAEQTIEVVRIAFMACRLTSRAQARGTNQRQPRSGTGPAIPRCLERFIRHT
jgi:hypothetical protein